MNGTMSDDKKCELCGEPMPPGETMFKYHGFSGPCPKPPIPNTRMASDLVEIDGTGIRFLQRIPEKLTRERAIRLAGEIAAILDPNTKEITPIIAAQMLKPRCGMCHVRLHGKDTESGYCKHHQMKKQSTGSPEAS